MAVFREILKACFLEPFLHRMYLCMYVHEQINLENFVYVRR